MYGIEARCSLMQFEKYTVATAPQADEHEGAQIYVENGAAGSPVMAFSDGTNWLRCDTKAAIAAA